MKKKKCFRFGINRFVSKFAPIKCGLTLNMISIYIEICFPLLAVLFQRLFCQCGAMYDRHLILIFLVEIFCSLGFISIKVSWNDLFKGIQKKKTKRELRKENNVTLSQMCQIVWRFLWLRIFSIFWQPTAHTREISTAMSWADDGSIFIWNTLRLLNYFTTKKFMSSISEARRTSPEAIHMQTTRFSFGFQLHLQHKSNKSNASTEFQRINFESRSRTYQLPC